MMFRAPWLDDLTTRLARRELSRHRARSALVLALVALPVALVCALGMLGGLGGLVRPEFGDATAKVTALVGWDGTCLQEDLSQASCSTPAETRAPRQPDFSPVSSLGDHLTEVSRPITWDKGGLSGSGHLVAVDLASPLARSLWRAEGPATPAADEVLVSAMSAERYGIAVGDDLTITGRHYRVAGTVRTDDGYADLVVGPQHRLASGTGSTRTDYLFGAEPSITTAHDLNRHGLGVVTRSAFRQLNSDDGGRVTGQQVLVLVLLVVVMLTSTMVAAAFSIGIRQQRRSLALLSASGASPVMLRGLVVRQALLLGVVGSVAGAAVGIGVGEVLVWWVQRHGTGVPATPGIPWPLVVTSVGVGVVAAVVAAAIPARTVARQDVLVAIRQAESAQQPARFPRLAPVLLVLGVLAGAIGPGLWPSGREQRADGTVPVESVIGPGSICVLLCFLAALTAVPWLLDRLGRGARGPLAWRMALRDAARNRSRATAVVAASLAISSLVGLLLVAEQSMGQTDLDHYRYQTRIGVGVVQDLDGGAFPDARWQQARDAITRVVPIRADAVQRQPILCVGKDPTTCSNPVMLASSTACGSNGCSGELEPVTVYDAKAFALVVGRQATGPELSVLASGGVLVDPEVTSEPRGQLTSYAGAQEVTRTVALGHVTGLHRVVMASQQTVRRLAPGARVVATGRYFDTGIDPTPAQLDALANAAARSGVTGQTIVSLEQGPHSSYLSDLPSFGATAAVLMLVVAGLAGALSLRDAREAHATLAGVGASSATLRGMAAVQTLVAVALGSLLGLVVGAVPMVLMVLASRGGVSLGIPWGWLAGLVVGVPAVAAVLAFLVVRPPVARPVRVD